MITNYNFLKVGINRRTTTPIVIKAIPLANNAPPSPKNRIRFPGEALDLNGLRSKFRNANGFANGFVNHWDGALSELRIWFFPLNSSKIKNQYNKRII